MCISVNDGKETNNKKNERSKAQTKFKTLTWIVADKTVILAMQQTKLDLSQLLSWLARTSQT